MQQLAEGKCRLDSDLHEPRMPMEAGNEEWHNKDFALDASCNSWFNVLCLTMCLLSAIVSFLHTYFIVANC
jgi:hypothetical protein